MPKPLCSHWFLQKIADMEVARLAPGHVIVPIVRHDDDQILWDVDCKGVGRAAWCVDYFVSPEDPSARALVPALNAAMAPYQRLYDLGLTCE